MAMALEGKNRHYHWDGIRLRHWLEAGKRCGVPGMATLVREIIDRTPAALAVARRAIPADFPAAIADSILGGVQAAAQRLGDEMAAMPREA